jgi:hypothetical protein
MNERIQKLALQAGGGPSKWYTDPDVLEYFAELIIKECVDSAVWVGNFNTKPIEPIHTAMAIKQRINNRFGVEE